MSGSEKYSLRQVVELTGLSEFTLRGWEGRYQAFSPGRTDTGRRVYSSQDLQKALLLRELTKREYRIGDIASLSLVRLKEMLGQKAFPDTEAGQLEPAIQEPLNDLSLQNWEKLRAAFQAAARKKDALSVIRDWAVPLLRETGALVAGGHVSISQEHIFSAFFKEFLFQLLAKSRAARSRSRLLIASPEGDFHELGILLAHVLAAHHGLHTLYLGPNSPKQDLCETALRYGATHVLLGSTVSRKEGAREDFWSYLHFLDRHLAKETALWFGGRNTSALAAALKRPQQQFPSLEALNQALEQLR